MTNGAPLIDRARRTIVEHAALLDYDERNPAHYDYGEIGNTGYWVFRIGGRLSPRVIFGLCLSMPNFGLNEVRSLIEQNIKFGLTRWEACKIYEDGKAKTKCLCGTTAAKTQ